MARFKPREPRYDDVYFEGVRKMDELDEENLNLESIKYKFECGLCGNSFYFTQLQPNTHWVGSTQVQACVTCYMLFKIDSRLSYIEERLRNE